MGGSTFSVAGRRVVVVGAARSGMAAADLLLSRGALVTVTDRRPHIEGAEALARRGAALELGHHEEATLAGADLVVVSPGVPPDLPALVRTRESGVEVIGELELAWRWLRGRVVAVTGTKGKSTTATIVGRMLEAEGRRVVVGGNIGVPLSAQVEASTPDTIHVVEVSSFQLEAATSFRPWIALWLNLTDDHLDRHGSIGAYAAAKARIFAHQRPGDWAVVNADDPHVMAASESLASTRVLFAASGRIAEGFVLDGDWIVRRTATAVEPLVPVSAVELAGRHMLGNVLAATAVAAVAGAAPAAMARGLRGFRGLEHVMEPAGTVGGVRFVNDSKATNVEAACRAIESFDRDVVAIVGGRFKGGSLRDLREPLRGRGRAVVAIGEAAPRVREALADLLPVVDAASMAEAVAAAYAAAAPGGVVLLAPACASFDWFEDYAERGRAFKEEVRRLAGSMEPKGAGREQAGRRKP